MNTAIAATGFNKVAQYHNLNSNVMPRKMLSIPPEIMSRFIKSIQSIEAKLQDNNQVKCQLELPEWQKQMLLERTKEIVSGKATFTRWEDFEKELENDGMR